jgi:hypothetical protein
MRFAPQPRFAGGNRFFQRQLTGKAAFYSRFTPILPTI